jgi:tetratricopeptide (TPR) repeat protein
MMANLAHRLTPNSPTMSSTFKRFSVPIGLAIFLVTLLLAVSWWQVRTSVLRHFIPSAIQQSEVKLTDSTAIPAKPNIAIGGTVGTLREGDLLAEQGRWSEALVVYKAAVTEDSSLLALRKQMQAQLQLSKYDEAVETLAALRSAGAKSQDILLLQNIILLRTGKTEEAKKSLESAVESEQRQYGLLLLAIAQGDHNAAKVHASAVLGGTEPILRSNAQILLGAYEEYALFPESTNSHLITLLARALAEIQECTLALSLVPQVTASTPSYRDAWIVQGFCELQTEKYNKAIASYVAAYNIDPQKVPTQYFLGLSYYYNKEYQNAITFFEYALTNGFTPRSELHSLIANSAKKLGNSTLALTHFNALLELEPSEEHYIATIQTALYVQDSTLAYQKALAMVSAYPDSSNSYELLGMVQESMNNTTEAKESYRKALAIDGTRTLSKERAEAL